MKLRGLLAGGAVVIAATAMTSAATSAHAATNTTSTSTPGSVQVNLSSEYHAALQAEAGKALPKPAITRPLGYHATGVSPTTCSEPNCNLWYHGGLVQTFPRVYVVFWGPKWKLSTYGSARSFLIHLYQGLGNSTDHWSTSMTQYNGKNGHPTFGGTSSVYKGSYIDGSTPPSSVGQSQIAAEAAAIATRESLKGYNLQIVVASQSGTCFSDGFAGSCGSVQSNGQYCAWHSSSSSLTFTNLPYQPDAQGDCGQNWNGYNAPLAGFSIVGGHEYAETVTDPFPASGWVDLQDNVSGGENGDKCAWGGQIWGGNDPIGYQKFSTGSFIMQSLWSNSAHKCVM